MSNTPKTTRDDGGPAFPQPMAGDFVGGMYCSSEKGPAFAGMTLRDWFAGMAIQSLCANDGFNSYCPDVAEYAYKLADAMLKERK